MPTGPTFCFDDVFETTDACEALTATLLGLGVPLILLTVEDATVFRGQFSNFFDTSDSASLTKVPERTNERLRSATAINSPVSLGRASIGGFGRAEDLKIKMKEN